MVYSPPYFTYEHNLDLVNDFFSCMSYTWKGHIINESKKDGIKDVGGLVKERQVVDDIQDHQEMKAPKKTYGQILRLRLKITKAYGRGEITKVVVDQVLDSRKHTHRDKCGCHL